MLMRYKIYSTLVGGLELFSMTRPGKRRVVLGKASFRHIEGSSSH